METETIERIKRAKIQIQKNNPFFAYLSLFLKFKEVAEDDVRLTNSLGAGVNAKGEFIYKKSFIDSMSDDRHLIGVIIHEILHLSLLHLLRRNSRNFELWNISCDMAVNQLIKDNGFILPKGVFWSDEKNTITFMGYKVKEVDKKNSEEIYEELFNHFKTEDESEGEGESDSGESNGNGEGEDNSEGEGEENENDNAGNGKGKPKQNQNQIGKKKIKNVNEGRFDKHIEEKLTEEEKRKQTDEWLEKISEAYVCAKMRGNVPLGIERLIGKLHEQKINWRAILQRFITNSIPQDYTYTKPNKKSISAGFYMPDTSKEKINVLVGIDLSGSISGEELTDFVSEIVGMARTFREQISFRLLTHDVEVHNDYLVENGNIEKIKHLNMKGGGGTSHNPIFDYIKEKYRDTQVAIFLTDGESDLESIKFNEYRFKKLFVISKNGRDDFKESENCRGCKTIKLD